jgi:hypothetical protein
MMDAETFEQHFKAARFHENLPAIVRYREPDGSYNGCFYAYRYHIHQGRAVILYSERTGEPSLDLLLSDIYEVY